MKNGYAFVKTEGACEIELVLKMPARVVVANRRVHDCAGRVAVMRGPVVYCAEGADNFADLGAVRIDPEGKFELRDGEFMLPNLEVKATVPKESGSLYADAREQEYEDVALKLIPYYAFANRGSDSMQVWFLKK